MARPLRIQYPGAVYHVMARGNQGRPIFKDDKDRRRFLETFEESCQKTGWVVHAYVLMGNHYHLLVETPEGNLVAGMKWLQGTYTQRYNGRHKVFGHLFQGRYKAVVVDGGDANYLQFVSTYIHLNPARAGLIRIGREKLKSYRWSSYPWYLSRRCPGWISRATVLGSLGLAEEETRGYEAVKGRRRESHSGAAKERHDETAAERLLEAGLRALALTKGKLGNLPKTAPEKVVLAWWLRGRTTVRLEWVSQRLQMGHYTRVTQAVSRISRRPGRRLRPLQAALLKLVRHEDGKN